jgi:hypothetical protein
MFKEEPGGRIALDFLPYFVTDAHHPDRDVEREIAIQGSLWYRRPYKLHRSIGVQNASVICPSSVGKKCPICEYRAKQLSEGAKWQDEQIKAMRPSDRNLYYVVPKGDSKKYDEKPYFWDIAQFLFQEALNNELEENEDFGEFPDLEAGLTLRIRFSEEKFERTSFAKTSRIDFEERDYAYDEAVVRELTSLDEVLDIKDYREVERLFFETDGGDEEGADQPTDQPKTGSGGSSVSLTRPKSETTTTSPRQSSTIESTTRSTITRPRQAAEPSPGESPGEATPSTVIRRRSLSSPTQSVESNKNQNGEADKCPSGYRFGVDTDAKDECERCQVWNECMDAREAAAAR